MAYWLTKRLSKRSNTSLQPQDITACSIKAVRARLRDWKLEEVIFPHRDRFRNQDVAPCLFLVVSKTNRDPKEEGSSSGQQSLQEFVTPAL